MLLSRKREQMDLKASWFTTCTNTLFLFSWSRAGALVSVQQRPMLFRVGQCEIYQHVACDMIRMMPDEVRHKLSSLNYDIAGNFYFDQTKCRIFLKFHFRSDWTQTPKLARRTQETCTTSTTTTTASHCHRWSRETTWCYQSFAQGPHLAFGDGSQWWSCKCFGGTVSQFFLSAIRLDVQLCHSWTHIISLSHNTLSITYNGNNG